MAQGVLVLKKVGMRIEFLHEFPNYSYNNYTFYDVENDNTKLFPCTFSLKVRAIKKIEFDMNNKKS